MNNAQIGDKILSYDNEQTTQINKLSVDYVVELIRTDLEVIKKWNSGVLEIDGTYQGTPDANGRLSIPMVVTLVNTAANNLPVMTAHYNSTPNVVLVASSPTSTELRCYLNDSLNGTPITASQRVSYSYVGRWK